MQDVWKITEQWKFIPSVVEELAKLEGKGDNMAFISKKDLCKHAMECKQIYEVELSSLEDDSVRKKKRPKNDEQKRDCRRSEITAAGYDSDETIEMTEEEIDHAFKTVSSKIHKN